MSPGLFERARPNPAGYRDVAPAEVWAERARLRLIDVREPDEYTGELGHVPGAALVPVATVGAAAGGWSPDDDIVLICRSGARSGRVADALARAGFRVMNLVGGMIAWNAAQLPVER